MSRRLFALIGVYLALGGSPALAQVKPTDPVASRPYVDGALAGKAPIASPTFTGTMTAPKMVITGTGSTGDVSGMTAFGQAMLNATAAGRSAVEQSDGAGLKVSTPSASAPSDTLARLLYPPLMFSAGASALPACTAGSSVAPVPAGQPFRCAGLILIAQ